MTAQEIKIAKATSRSAGAAAIKDGKIRAGVPLWVESNVDKSKTILDFGAGKGATSTKYLLSKGFDVVAYDLWVGNGDVLLDKFALNRQYDIVFASNVLNVQSSLQMLFETLNQIKLVMENNGEFVCNQPQSPGKMDLKETDIEEILLSMFDSVERVGGTKSAPVWRVKKTQQNT